MGEEFIRRVMILGSVPSLGPVVLFDDMEGLLKWAKADGAGDSVIEKSGTVAYNGSYSLHFKSRTTGATAGDVIAAYRKVHQRPGKRYRLELLWMPDSATGVTFTSFEVQIFDGVNVSLVRLRWDIVLAKWQYWNSAGAWADVTGGAQNLQVNQFHRLAFEWDQNSGKYLGMVSDALEVDLSALDFQQSASAGAQEFDFRVSLIAGSIPPGEVYLDDVLVIEI
jgi:hypothetical protein